MCEEAPMHAVVPPYTLRIAQADQFSGVDRTSLYQAMKDGKLVYLKRGKVRLIRVSDLQRWLDSHEASEGEVK
jgi:predicted DNA-binding transcriptional regulator AlpA